MRVVAVDAQVLVWGLRGGGHGAQHDLAELEARALLLLDRLGEEGAEVVVSSVVAAELLGPLSDAEREALERQFAEDYYCVNFDFAMAREAARLFMMRAAIPAAVQPTRNVLKYDTLIVAAAKLAGAATVYSHDAGTRATAELAGLQGLDLPDLA